MIAAEDAGILPITIAPGATLRVVYDVQAVQLGKRLRTDCVDYGSCDHSLEIVPIGPIPVGEYTLELVLPMRLRNRQAALVRTSLTVVAR